VAGIEIRVSVDDNLINLTHELRDFNKRLDRGIARQVIPRAERELDRIISLARLDEQPPRRTRKSPKFIWSLDPKKNARARGWFFYHFPNGYERTGALAKNWKGTIIWRKNELTVAIGNIAPGASQVYGSPRHQWGQVPGHVTTGWFNAKNRLPRAVDMAAEFLENRLDEFVGEQLKKL
jgi:hypothetical protein